MPALSHLQYYVRDDIERYGARLSDLLARLERTRQERLDSFCDDERDRVEQEAAEAALFDTGGEAFQAGDFAARLGEDFFGLAENGLELELNTTSLAIPKWMLRGASRPLENDATRSVLILTLVLYARADTYCHSTALSLSHRRQPSCP